jgi:formylmethanofuran dehydrogenase subunit E
MNQLKPIGAVVNSITEPVAPDEIRRVPSRIRLDPQLELGLKGLEAGQQIMVLFRFHRAPEEYELLQHPRGDRNRPKKGIFSLRSPQRPNRIGVTTVELIKIEGNILHVRNLDAINGTPVLDIKPV